MKNRTNIWLQSRESNLTFTKTMVKFHIQFDHIIIVTSHPFPPAPPSRTRQTGTLSYDFGTAPSLSISFHPKTEGLSNLFSTISSTHSSIPFPSASAQSQQPHFIFFVSASWIRTIHKKFVQLQFDNYVMSEIEVDYYAS